MMNLSQSRASSDRNLMRNASQQLKKFGQDGHSATLEIGGQPEPCFATNYKNDTNMSEDIKSPQIEKETVSV